MRALLLVLAAALAVFGCAAFATMRYTSDASGSAGPRRGMVEYRDSGVWGLIGSGRRDAEDQMRAYCAPDTYEVTAVNTRTAYDVQGHAREYAQVNFQCVPSHDPPSS